MPPVSRRITVAACAVTAVLLGVTPAYADTGSANTGSADTGSASGSSSGSASGSALGSSMLNNGAASLPSGSSALASAGSTLNDLVPLLLSLFAPQPSR